MKSILSTLFGILLFISNSKSQTTPNIEKESKTDSSKYYFSKFLDGRIFMKNGKVSDAKLNYYIPESIIAYKDENNVTLFLSDLDNIDSVVISNFSYLKIENKFYEIITNLGSGRSILAQYKGSGHPIADIGNDSVSHNNELASNNLTSIYVRKNYKYSTSQGLSYSYQYWDGTRLFKINSVKDLYKYFPEKKNELLKFVDINNLKLNNIESATKIFEKLSTL